MRGEFFHGAAKLFCLAAFCFALCPASGAAAASGKKEGRLPLVEHPAELAVGEPFLLKARGVPTGGAEVLWLNRSFALKGEDGGAELLLPVPLSVKQDSLELVLRAPGTKTYKARLKVKSGDFPVQHLSVDPRFVVPPPEEIPRIERERARVRAIYGVFTQENYLRLPLLRPLSGGLSSEFGARRFFNGEPRNRHLGTDFRGPEGTEARAVASGVVVLTEAQYYAGNILILDHGRGVYSAYMHLSAFKAGEGQRVEAGEVVGLVGQTGRVTGPHLHLGLVIQGEYQTAEPFMPDFR